MRKRILIIVLSSIGVFIAAAYLACCVLFYRQVDKLLFFPVVNDPALAQKWHASRIEIPTGETTIEGWWVENPGSASNAVLIYFGGNAEDVLYMAEDIARYDVRRVLLTTYRGYGATPGTPSQSAFFNDALAIYDYAIAQPQISAADVVVAGHSLGSGVASFLAANRPVGGVILITPYDSIAAVVQVHYPYLPVRWLMRNPFPAEEFARRARAPLLIVAAQDDTLISPRHAQRLYAAWAGPGQIRILDGVGHNDIQGHDQYYPLINAFLESSFAE